MRAPATGRAAAKPGTPRRAASDRQADAAAAEATARCRPGSEPPTKASAREDAMVADRQTAGGEVVRAMGGGRGSGASQWKKK